MPLVGSISTGPSLVSELHTLGDYDDYDSRRLLLYISQTDIGHVYA